MNYILDKCKITDEGIYKRKTFGKDDFISYDEMVDFDVIYLGNIRNFNIKTKDGKSINLYFEKDKWGLSNEIVSAVKTRINPNAKDVLVNGQYVVHCKSCDKLTFFSPADIKKMSQDAGRALGSAIGGVAASMSGQYVATNQMIDRAERLSDIKKDPVSAVRISKVCPYCNSKDIEYFNESDYNDYLSRQGKTYDSNKTSEADELRKFKTLLDDGVITQEEFEAKKKLLLGL